MNFYNNQDKILEKFHIGIQDLNNIPFWRYQIMITNLNESAKENSENKENISNQINTMPKIPNYSGSMRSLANNFKYK